MRRGSTRTQLATDQHGLTRTCTQQESVFFRGRLRSCSSVAVNQGPRISAHTPRINTDQLATDQHGNNLVRKSVFVRVFPWWSKTVFFRGSEPRSTDQRSYAANQHGLVSH